MSDEAFVRRYGPYALVAGGSEGLGAAFAEAIAARGLSLILVARSTDKLDELAARLRRDHHVDVKTEAFDLSAPDLPARFAALADAYEIGLVVYNAAASSIGPFLETPLDQHQRILDVNCRGPLVLAHVFGALMVERGRGGIVLMSSLAAGQGSPYIATYAASKAFDLVLGESLWMELAERGVDVVACRAGATRTPGYERSKPDFSGPIMEPAPVAEAALHALGRAPSTVAGGFNRLAAFFMARVMTRARATRVMGDTTAKIYRIQR